VLLEESIDHAVLVGERTRMRARGVLPGRGASRLERDHRQPALTGDARGLRERGGIPDRLEVEQQQLEIGVLGDHGRHLGHRHVGIVAGGLHVAHADTLVA